MVNECLWLREGGRRVAIKIVGVFFMEQQNSIYAHVKERGMLYRTQ